MNFDLIAKHITPRSVLDIGANTGGWYREAKSRWPDAYFFLIEGNPACAEYLAATGESFRIALLSDAEKEVEFFTRVDAPTCTGSSYKREKTEFYADDKINTDRLPTARLADVCEGSVFDLIKIDTQGSELDILRGGIDIARAAKAIVMEVSLEEYNDGAPLADETLAFMASLGFRATEVLQEIVHPIKRHVIQNDLLFIR